MKPVFFDVSYVTESAVYRSGIEAREGALKALRFDMRNSLILFGVYHSELESLSKVHTGCGMVGTTFIFNDEIASALRLWDGAGDAILGMGFVAFIDSLGFLEQQ